MIETARLSNVLFTGRPPYGQSDATIGIFKLVEGGSHAERVQVKFGRTSVSRVEIVEGLNPGDIIITGTPVGTRQGNAVRGTPADISCKGFEDTGAKRIPAVFP